MAIDIHHPSNTTTHTHSHVGVSNLAPARVVDTIRNCNIEPISFDNVLRDIEAFGGGSDVRGCIEGIAGHFGLLCELRFPLWTLGRRTRNVLECEQVGQPRGGIVWDRVIHSWDVRNDTQKEDGRWGDHVRVSE